MIRKDVFRFQIIDSIRNGNAHSLHSISDLLFVAADFNSASAVKKKLLFQTTPPPIALTICEHLLPTASGRIPSGYQTLLASQNHDTRPLTAIYQIPDSTGIPES